MRLEGPAVAYFEGVQALGVLSVNAGANLHLNEQSGRVKCCDEKIGYIATKRRGNPSLAGSANAFTDSNR